MRASRGATDEDISMRLHHAIAAGLDSESAAKTLRSAYAFTLTLDTLTLSLDSESAAKTLRSAYANTSMSCR